MTINKAILYPILIGIAAIILIMLIRSFFIKDEPPTVITTIDTMWTKPDTIAIDRYINIIKVKSRIDTIIVNSQQVEVASADTVIAIDSSRIAVKYYGTPLNYFDIHANIKEKRIKETVYITKNVETIIHEQSGFFDRFGVSLQSGAGYDILNNRPAIYIGLGFHFKLN